MSIGTQQISYPAADQSAKTLPVTIGSVSGAITVMPTPGSVLLQDGQTVTPGSPAVQYAEVYYTFQAPDKVLYYLSSASSATSSGSIQSTSTPNSTLVSITSDPAPPGATGNTTQATNASGISTTASVSTTSTANPQPLRVTSGVTPGGAAGIAIGCLIAGGAISALLLWVCWRRRKPLHSRYSESNTVPLVSPEKGFSTNASPLSGQGLTAATLSSGLPQPLEDKAISGDISKISNAIKNHVQSYYHTRHVSSALIDYGDLQALSPNMPHSVGTISTLLENSATREIALRFCIAWVIVSRMQNHGELTNTLLPLEIIHCYRKITDADDGSKDHSLLAAHWRVATAELMQLIYANNSFTPSDSRSKSVRAAVTALDNILQPYADSCIGNEERKRNLEELVKRSAVFAFTLFSQPSSWEFDWKDEQNLNSGELCVFPALVQVKDETGESIRPPRQFSEAVVRRVDN